MNALNWPSVVQEALRRRKAERLTQKEHAALADVSIPTIVAFDQGKRTLSLTKAFDILRVVGLVEEPVPEDAQDVFVREAFTRWQALTAGLPENSPGRFRHGWYRIDYALEGAGRTVSRPELTKMLRHAIVPFPKWPMFAFPNSSAPDAHETGGFIDSWCRPEIAYSPFYDFWRADPKGRMFLIRGYSEDVQETFLPGTIFDAVLPIWRLSEALSHAARLASLLSLDIADTTVRLRVLFTGLAGRSLKTWSKPMSAEPLLGGQPARSDEVLCEVSVPASRIDENLSEYVLALTAPLYERFGVAGLSLEGVHAELTRMRENRFG